MPAYRFEAVDATGRATKGLLEADNAKAARAQLRAQAALLSPPIRADVSEMSIPGPAGPIPARHYVPDGSGVAPASALLVFFHGGGFVLGDMGTHDSLCRLVCRDGGIQVLSVDYRLAPEHKAPAAAERRTSDDST